MRYDAVMQFFADFNLEVSSARLATYRRASGSDLQTVVDYLWNMALAEALSPSLAALEVGVRNSIHDALTAFYGTDLWFYDRDFIGNRILDQELARAVGRLGGHAARPSAGRIVAELHFFYWTTILSGYYHAALWNPDHAALLRAVFPHVHGPQFRRDRIHQRYNIIRMFRNRVMHHEPLLYGLALPGQPVITLAAIHGNIIEAIGWSSPRLQAAAAILDRFPDVLTHGRSTLEHGLKRQLGIS
jgi:hypothetical protein